MFDKAKRYYHHIQLKNKQRVIDKQFEKEGLTDDVLAKQVEVNTMRNELDIPDKNEFIYEEFVQ